MKEEAKVRQLVRAWRPAVRLLAFALALAVLPLPVSAGQQDQTTPKPGIRASIAKAVAAEPPAASKEAAAVVQDDPGAKLNSPSFFKTPVGIAVVAIIAAGTGFAIYSASNDRIKSPGR